MTELVSQDQLFLRKLTEIVEINLTRESFDVEEMAREANMSRSAIHPRLRTLGKLNASHFIREIRLQKARELLHNGFSTASEVSYRVGFGSPTYFSRCFHEYYGFPPGEERKRIGIDETATTEIFPGVGQDEKKRVGLNEGSISEFTPEVVDKLRRAPVPKPSKSRIIIMLALLVTVIAAILLEAELNPSGESENKSIMVLPFRNLTGEPDNQYFADGIMEDILNSLNKVSDLRVISRTTSEHFRGTSLRSGDISREAGARNILEGSIRRQGNTVRVTVQLIDGRRERHIWSQNFDRELTDTLGLQDEIASEVAGQIKAIISDRPGSKE